MAWPIQAQTYKVDPNASEKTPGKAKQQPPPEQPLGWGSNIQNARFARAAEQALQKGDHAAAVNFAQRAAQAAPNDAHLWFLLGYAARLDSKLSLALDSYNRGLRVAPNSLDGLSGLAQTYNVMGRTDDAQKLLRQVVAADSRRRGDVMLLGDILLRTGDYPAAIELLTRAERLEPAVRSELLLAIAYQRTNQMEQANRYLEAAKKRAPNDPEVQRSLAGYYRAVSNYPAAIAALKSIKNPKPDIRAELAYTYQLNGELENSAKQYALAANAMPRDMNLQLSAAQAHVAINAIDQANTFLEHAAKIDKDYYRLHAVRGQIAQLQDRSQDSITEYTAAIAHLPATPSEGPLYGIQLHMNLYQLYQGTRQPDPAQQQLKIAQQQIGVLDERGANRPAFLRLRSMIKLQSGQLDGALADAKEAVALSPKDLNNLQLNGDVLMKLGRPEDAIAVYKQGLALDGKNRFALTSLGYASRAAGHDQDAESYFKRLAQYHPDLYVPYLALGDLYTARKDFERASSNYNKGFALAPKNALVVAGGLNAAIEQHNMTVAALWMSRATPDMDYEPQILREQERYLRIKGDYARSEEVGRRALAALPHDRDVVVYLGYDLLNQEKYDDLLKLTNDYRQAFPKDADLPLLAGYVHKHQGDSETARKDFSEALERDPNVVTAYVNRGYVLNDLGEATLAAADFEAAISRDPKNGEAHLGLAYSNLDLRRPQLAIKEVELAREILGDSVNVHLIRATAYGRQGMLTKAAGEYRAALKFTPNDGSLYFGLGSVLFAQRRYRDSVDALGTADRLDPNNALIYALMARGYANLKDREQTLHYADLAERNAANIPRKKNRPNTAVSDIYVSTGQALSILGDQEGAMQRFSKALTTPESDRVNVRMAIAQLMVQKEQYDDAKRQVVLAQMEADMEETAQPTGEQYVQAADVFRSMHEYQLSQSYLERARNAGASDTSVRIGMANNYLAVGDTERARNELNAVKRSDSSEDDYQFLLVQATLFQQEHQGPQALTAFAQAANASGEDQSAQQSLLEAGANEGYQVNSTVSLLANFSMNAIFEDPSVYVLDSKLDAPTPVPPTDYANLPPPRSSLQTQGTVAYHLHAGQFPPMGGFFQVRNSRGTISVPATSSIVKRSTTDYNFNFGVSPTVRVARNAITFNGGVQGTLRRDSESPVALNQNLVRVFGYFSTTSFFNALAVDGYIIRESGPFTQSNISSSALSGAINFRVGEPWSKTNLITGWGRTDQKFTPVGVENYYTTAYVGFTRRFSRDLDIRALVEDLRAWRVVGDRSAIAQTLRPSGTVNYSPSRDWNLQLSSAYANTRGFHTYDMFQNSLSVSYVHPLHRSIDEQNGELRYSYPIRFGAGIQQETFPNFAQGKNQQFRPYISVTIF